MRTAARSLPPSVDLEDLVVGEMLAEGGEGRVFELPTRPHLVFKAYRNPPPRGFLDDLVGWPATSTGSGIAACVSASTAWPAAVVTGGGAPAGKAAGVLLPRAPRRFAVRHRDGTTRLATLSYLTADPAYRAVAYGLSLPPSVSAERIGLVYALARLIDGFQASDPRVGHGDLSTKNVLWSLQKGPEVFVLDCDGCERYDPDGDPLAHAGRRRAATPNWEDPALTSGSNPTLESDRYSLALIFLRVVGAANFPMQARQRQGGPVTVDFAVPPGLRDEPLLAPGAPLWGLVERGLSVSSPAARPLAAEWSAALEALLDALGAAPVMRSVWQAQGGGSPSPAGVSRPAPAPEDVHIRPVAAAPRATPRWTLVGTDPASAWRHPRPARITAAAGATRPVSPPSPVAVQATSAATGPPPALVRTQLAQAVGWWAEQHQRALGEVRAPGRRRDAVRSVAWCAVVDALLGLVLLFLAAMVVAPVLGI